MEAAMRMRSTAFAGLLALVWGMAAQAHLCDDVWRQMDKLILKPDVTNLVAKPGEKTEFNVLMQHNMDRPIACAVRLIGDSPGFDVAVEPTAGHNPVRPGQPYTYKVSLSAKAGRPAGNYPVSFRLMGNDMRKQPRELKSLTLGGAAAPGGGTSGATGGASAAGGGPAARRVTVTGLADRPAPVIDGNIDEPAWRGPTPLSAFTTDGTARARRTTLIVPRCDADRLWIMVTCPGMTAADIEAGDAVVLWLANPEKRNQRVCVRVESTGALKVFHYVDEASKTVDPALCGIKAAAASGDKGWYAEVEIPAPVLGRERIDRDQTWLVNFARDCKATPAELSFWCGTPATGPKVAAYAEFRLTP
jgi:hypothetical protein